MTENLEKIRPALVALEVGDSVTFHISRLKSICTSYCLQSKKTY